MATLVPIPKLGQSEETVSIVRWHKSELDTVKKGEVLFEIETDKAVLEVESQFAGTLLKIIIPAGKEVPVMSVCAVIGAPGEPLPPIPEPAAATAKPATPAAKPPPAQVAQSAEKAPVALATAPSAQPLTSAPPVAPAVARKRAISPRARKFGADFLIDLQAVPGTGPNGRVIEKDVRDYLKTSGYQDRRITPSAVNLARKLGLKLLDITATGETGRITIADVRRTEAERPKALSKMRQIIARRLQQSKQVIPHFYTTVSVDVTALLAFRKELKAAGHSYSVTDFLLWAIARTLTEFPAVNSHTEDNISSIWNSRVNLGLAVSLENGLVVPVIANADKMGLDELHDVAGELADKARSGKLLPQEMQGGTFTISNMGMLNVENFAAIINPGESAILAVSSAIPCAVVNDRREVVVRDMMKLTLSADHRLVDGAMAAAFLNAVRRCVEDLARWKAILGV